MAGSFEYDQTLQGHLVTDRGYRRVKSRRATQPKVSQTAFRANDRAVDMRAFHQNDHRTL